MCQVWQVPGKTLTDIVNQMASNLTSRYVILPEVTTAVANGDLCQKMTVDVKGEILELKNTINHDGGLSLNIFAVRSNPCGA